MDRIPIGKLIRRRREELGVTQEELGQDNIDPGTISKIENGKADPTSRTLRTLLQRLNLPDTYYTVPVTENEATLENLLLEARAKVVAAQGADSKYCFYLPREDIGYFLCEFFCYFYSFFV